jgi:hypothetical protein
VSANDRFSINSAEVDAQRVCAALTFTVSDNLRMNVLLTQRRAFEKYAVNSKQDEIKQN